MGLSVIKFHVDQKPPKQACRPLSRSKPACPILSLTIHFRNCYLAQDTYGKNKRISSGKAADPNFRLHHKLFAQQPFHKPKKNNHA